MKPTTKFLCLLLCTALWQFSIAQPTITSFTPTKGNIGTTVTIAGTNFNTTAANNVVMFGATAATVTAASATSLTVTVPNGATYAPITVLNKTSRLSAYSTTTFTPTYTLVSGSTPTITYASPRQNLNTNRAPYSMSIGDLDGDGKSDLAITNSSDDNVSIFLNTSSVAGTTSYSTTKVNVPTGAQPFSIAIGDFDGDGKPDLATANRWGKSVSVLRNTSTGAGNISYNDRQNLSLDAFMPQSIAIGDLDGDGKPDLVTTNTTNNSISIFRNISTKIDTITFATNRIDLTTGTSPQSVAIGDLDGDGRPELAVTNGSKMVSVFRNTSTAGIISYDPVSSNFETFTYPFSVAIGDLDGDGKSDIAVANYGGSNNFVSVFQNTSTAVGTISFANKVDFTTGNSPNCVTIGDLNGDGKPELVVANSNGNSVSILRNTSTGSGNINYATKVDLTAGTYPQSVAIGDLDGDQKPELVSVNTNDNTASIFQNISKIDQTITFNTLPDKEINEAPFTLQATASSGLAVSYTSSNAAVATVSGNTLTIVGLGTTTITASQAGDANYNAAPNVTRTQTIQQIIPPSITSFTPTKGIPENTTVTITGTRFNTTAADNVVMFGATAATVTAASATSLTVTVPNGATYAPITVLNKTKGLLATSSKPFTPTFTNLDIGNSIKYASRQDINDGTSLSTNINSVAIGDLDQDGKPDLAMTNNLVTSNELILYKNTTTASGISYGSRVAFGIGNNPECVAIGDLNGDGKPDLAIANSGENTVSVIKNNNSGGTFDFSYTDRTNFNTTDAIYVAIGDLDQDGKPDLAVANYGSNTVSILRNTSTVSTISYATKIDFNTSKGPLSIAIGDLDDDGKPDLAVANKDDKKVSILRNTSTIGAISFANKVDYLTVDRYRSNSGSADTLVTPTSVAIGDFDDDGKPDLVAAGLSSFWGTNGLCFFWNKSTSGNIDFVLTNPYTTFVAGQFTSYNVVSLSDLNGDGKIDMAMANSTSRFSTTNIVIGDVVAFRNNRRTATDPMRFDSNKNNFEIDKPAIYVAVGDLDSDGKPELVTARGDNSFSIFRNITNSVLPVELVSFTATPSSEGVLLKWTTATEENNDYFEIESSVDAKTWKSVANVKGQGTTTLQTNYQHTDDKPYAGTSYYRLRQVDFDGKWTYSNMVSVDMSQIIQLSVSPNPSNGSQSVKISLNTVSKQDTQLVLRVVNLLGMELFNKQVRIVEKEMVEQQLDVHGLANGTYIIIAEYNGQVRQTKLIVRN